MKKGKLILVLILSVMLLVNLSPLASFAEDEAVSGEPATVPEVVQDDGQAGEPAGQPDLEGLPEPTDTVLSAVDEAIQPESEETAPVEEPAAEAKDKAAVPAEEAAKAGPDGPVATVKEATYHIDVEIPTAYSSATGMPNVKEANDLISVSTSYWVPTEDDVLRMASQLMGVDRTYETCSGVFLPGESYYGVAIIDFPPGESATQGMASVVGKWGVQKCGEAWDSKRYVLVFRVTIPTVVTVTIDFGSEHADYAAVVAAAATDVSMTASDGKVTYQTLKGTDLWYDVLQPIRAILNDSPISKTDKGEMLNPTLSAVNFKPMEQYTDWDEWYEDYKQIGTPPDSDITMYTQWLKPLDGAVRVEKPLCGTEVSPDQDADMARPEITVLKGDIQLFSSSWVELDADGLPVSFEGTMEAGQKYIAALYIDEPYPYYLDPNKITVEGGETLHPDRPLNNVIFVEVECIHDWGDWVVTKEPTLKAAGEKRRECKANPEHFETAAIPKLTGRTITYDLNGGTLDGKSGTVTLTVADGEIITLPEPTREGYTFDYWQGSSYKAGDKFTVDGDHTFTAQWIETGTAVETGDDTGLDVAMALALLSALAGAGVVCTRKRRGDL